MELALAALVVEPTIAAAAKKIGVAERTLRGWLKTPAFAASYRECCRAVLDASTSSLAAATADAVETLRRNLACGNPAAEIRAAAAILEHAYKAAELMDLMKRLESLEGGTYRFQIVEQLVTESNGHAGKHQTTPSRNGTHGLHAAAWPGSALDGITRGVGDPERT
jgi:hypothetical protein